jgi:hypothetical protein
MPAREIPWENSRVPQNGEYAFVSGLFMAEYAPYLVPADTALCEILFQDELR